ncbi:DUF3182 family protein [Ancylobacter defluvii]|uniref:DUF3182 domain-containing protein n=1 Tax=Ancylobacter defluvii TaxID=1282440 RepID=A0A9W6JRX0_9HYPH|nr:DUF3182 family protein [Ancylobacter defluvii]MBS7590088.1 DUF3182 family protein [Ancylobacter defluvii]GLK82710.1 hypothetical protein GCM10017653_07790 [Ancylobacter defluvii]
MDASAADRQYTDIASAPGRATPVVFLPADPAGRNHRQEGVRALARRIARLRGSDFIEAPAGPLPHGSYAVPTETLVGDRLAGRLGIQSEEDLFGGLVPYAVLAGKAITHGLVDADALRPEGWSPTFGEAVRGMTLRGASVFDRRSAAQAGRALLAMGPIRLKPAWADGGHGQQVLDEVGALDAALEAMDADELQSLGLVVEEDLNEATVYSIGRLRFGNRVFAYFGHQETTRNNAGQTAYGGSTLTVFPGALDELLERPMDAPVRQAVEYAQAYDRAALRHLPGLIASRRNYDVIAGRDARGDPRLGVLEQSWRIGGASGAEIAAVEAFHADPALVCVRASCVERYGARHEAPEDSIVYFDADDPEVGPLIKFARIEAGHRAL